MGIKQDNLLYHNKKRIAIIIVKKILIMKIKKFQLFKNRKEQTYYTYMFYFVA